MTVKRNHLDLYNQNLGTDNISVDKIDKFNTPAIVLQPKSLTVKDADLLSKLIDLKHGDFNLYIQYAGKILAPGKVYFNLGNYIKITNTLTDVSVIKLTGEKSSVNVEKIELDDMMCTITVCKSQLKDNPDVHKGFIEEHYGEYRDIIAENYYLNPYRLTQDELEDYRKEYGDSFSLDNCKIPGIFYDFVNNHKSEFSDLIEDLE